MALHIKDIDVADRAGGRVGVFHQLSIHLGRQHHMDASYSVFDLPEDAAVTVLIRCDDIEVCKHKMTHKSALQHLLMHGGW